MGGRVPDDDLPTAAQSKIVPADDLPGASAAHMVQTPQDNDVYGVGRFLKGVLGDAMSQNNAPLKAGIELAMQALTGYASKAAGGLAGAASLPFVGPERAAGVVHSVEEAGTYQPRSDAAKAATEQLGGIVAPVLGAAGRQTAKLGNAGETIVNAAAEAIPDVLPLGAALRPAARAARAAAAVEGAAAPAAPISETTTQAIDRGWNLRPSDVEKANPAAKGKVPGTTRQTLQNQGKLHSDAVLENQAKATDIGGREIGVEKATEILPKHLDELRIPHNKNYETAGKAAGNFADKSLEGDLESVWKAVSPEDNQQLAVMKIAKVYNPEGLSGPSLVKSIQKLRIDAAKGMNSTGTRDQIIGAAKKVIANKLEDALARRLDTMGDKQVVTAFRDSRQALAKIHNVEDSLTGGQIDPQKVLKLREAGAPLTEGLNEIADMAEKFPDVVRSAHGTSTGGGLPHTKTGVIGSTVGALVRKIPGLDVSTPGFRQKISAAGKGQQAAAGDAFNKVKPAKPVESNQGRQPDMIGPDMAVPPTTEIPQGALGEHPAFLRDGVRPSAPGVADPLAGGLGDQLEAFGPRPTEELTLQNVPGSAPRIPMRNTAGPTEEMIGPDYALARPEGEVGLVHANLGDQLEAFGVPPDKALTLLHPEGVTPPRPAMPPSPVRQEIMIGDELALSHPPGAVGVPSPLPNPANELGDQLTMFGQPPPEALALTPPPGIPAPVMPAAMQKKAPPKKAK
jgi:hypothetical protein